MEREQPVPFLNLCHLPGFGISPQPAWRWNLSPNSFPYMQLWRLSRLPMSVGWTIVARVGGRMTDNRLPLFPYISTLPVLSPNFSVGTLSLFSIATRRFDMVVSLGLRI